MTIVSADDYEGLLLICFGFFFSFVYWSIKQIFTIIYRITETTDQPEEEVIHFLLQLILI